jgi:hypothetical protein
LVKFVTILRIFSKNGKVQTDSWKRYLKSEMYKNFRKIPWYNGVKNFFKKTEKKKNVEII